MLAILSWNIRRHRVSALRPFPQCYSVAGWPREHRRRYSFCILGEYKIVSLFCILRVLLSGCSSLLACEQRSIMAADISTPILRHHVVMRMYCSPIPVYVVVSCNDKYVTMSVSFTDHRPKSEKGLEASHKQALHCTVSRLPVENIGFLFSSPQSRHRRLWLKEQPPHAFSLTITSDLFHSPATTSAAASPTGINGTGDSAS